MADTVVDESIFDRITHSLETNVQRILDRILDLPNCPSTNNMSFFHKETLFQKVTHAFNSITKEIENKLAAIWREESFYDVLCKRCNNVYLVISDFFTNHGWPIFFVVLVGIILWTNLKPKFDGWMRTRRHADLILARGTPGTDRSSADPHVVVRKHEAMDIARRKMQEHHDNQAAMFKEKLKKSATKLPTKPNVTKSASKERLLPDVNPLSRASCGPSYRPGASSFSSGG